MAAHLSTRTRLTIWTQAIVAAGVVLATTVFLEARLLSGISEWYALRLGVAFGLTQVLAVGVISVELVGSKWIVRFSRQRALRESPLVRDALTAHALGQDRWDEPDKAGTTHADGVSTSLLRSARPRRRPTPREVG